MATKQQTADVTKFTGFLAVDGSTHKTSALAVEHSRKVKLVSQVSDLADQLFDGVSDQSPGFSLDDRGNFVVGDSAGLTELLIANRDAIIAALTPQVLLRKPRTKKVKAAPAGAQEAVIPLPEGTIPVTLSPATGEIAITPGFSEPLAA